MVQTQAIYEYFTHHFQADSNFKLETYFKRGILNFTNVELKMNMFKAICITIPYLPGCKQVIFNKNGLRDEFAGLFLFGVFMNPEISSIHVMQNLMSDNFVATLRYLLKQFPKKITDLNLTNAVHNTDDMDVMLRKIEDVTSIKSLNFRVLLCQT